MLIGQGIFAVTHPVGRDIAGIAHWQAVKVRRPAQRLDDLEGRRFLALQPIRVDRVDQRDRRLSGDGLDQAHAVIEVALDLDHDRARDHGLGQLALGDLAARDHDKGRDAGPRRVSRGRGRGVAGGGADDGPGAGLHGLGDGHGHAAVLKRSSRIQALILDMDIDLAGQQPGDVVQPDQRRVALVEADQTGIGRDGQAIPVALDQAAPLGFSRARPARGGFLCGHCHCIFSPVFPCECA